MKCVAQQTGLSLVLTLVSVAALANPLCDTASFAQVQAVIGGSISKVDVIDVDDLHKLSCVYVDTQDLYNGLTIEFISDERLRKTNSKWSSAKAYFEEWSSVGDALSGVGEGAAWSSLTNSLLALRGDTVIQLSSGKADIKDAAVRSRFEKLASAVLAKLP